MKAIRIALAAALLAASAAAPAQSSTDARCVLLANAFMNQSKDANAQKLAEATLYFYLGRINPTETTAQMKTLLDQQGKTITDANAGALMGECVKTVQAKVQLLQTLAAQQTQQSKPAQQPQGR
jgi:hypothetical protein